MYPPMYHREHSSSYVNDVYVAAVADGLLGVEKFVLRYVVNMLNVM